MRRSAVVAVMAAVIASTTMSGCALLGLGASGVVSPPGLEAPGSTELQEQVATGLRNVAIEIETFATTHGGSYAGAQESPEVLAAVARAESELDGIRFTIEIAPSELDYLIIVEAQQLGYRGLGWDSSSDGLVLALPNG